MSHLEQHEPMADLMGTGLALEQDDLETQESVSLDDDDDQPATVTRMRQMFASVTGEMNRHQVEMQERQQQFLQRSLGGDDAATPAVPVTAAKPIHTVNTGA